MPGVSLVLPRYRSSEHAKCLCYVPGPQAFAGYIQSTGFRSPTLALDKTMRPYVAALRMTAKTDHQHELSKEMKTSCFHSTSTDCE